MEETFEKDISSINDRHYQARVRSGIKTVPGSGKQLEDVYFSRHWNHYWDINLQQWTSSDQRGTACDSKTAA
nr:unnamed protein product [Callosobruchus analis]